MAGKIINPGEFWPGVEPVKQETWLDGEWKVGPVQFGLCNVEMQQGFLIPLLTEAMAKRVVADHNAAQERDAYRALLVEVQAWLEWCDLPSAAELRDKVSGKIDGAAMRQHPAP